MESGKLCLKDSSSVANASPFLMLSGRVITARPLLWEEGIAKEKLSIIFLSIIFLDTPERLCFYTPPFGEV